jgi:hypothetical protein
MAGSKSIGAAASSVLMRLIAIEQMARAAVLHSEFRVVDLGSFAREVGAIAEQAELDQLDVVEALRNARVVRLQVVE